MNKMMVGLAALLLVSTVVLYLNFDQAVRDRRKQATALEQATGTVRTLEGRIAELTSSNTATMAALQAATTRAAAFRAQSASNAALLAELTNRISASNNFTPHPYQVRAYLGTQYVGMAWAIPSNYKRDPKTGLISYEQVVALPDAARGSITAFITNVVEQPVPAEPTVVQQHNYIDQRYFDQRYPWLWPSTIVYPPVKPLPPVRPVPPINPVRPLPPIGRDGIYHPPSAGSPGLYIPPKLPY